MDARERWQALQARLKDARAAFDAGDRDTALAAVNAALGARRANSWPRMRCATASWRWTRRTSHRAPRTPRLTPRTSRPTPAPRVRHLPPRTRHFAPRTEHLAPHLTDRCPRRLRELRTARAAAPCPSQDRRSPRRDRTTASESGGGCARRSDRSGSESARAGRADREVRRSAPGRRDAAPRRLGGCRRGVCRCAARRNMAAGFDADPVATDCCRRAAAVAGPDRRARRRQRHRNGRHDRRTRHGVGVRRRAATRVADRRRPTRRRADDSAGRGPAARRCHRRPTTAARVSPMHCRTRWTPPPSCQPRRPSLPRPERRDDDELIKQTLQRYRSAYEGLDAQSAHAVWPAVNEVALARAFDGLESQSLTFDACDVRQ